MSIEVVGVNQSWTQPSTLLPITSTSPPPTSSSSTTSFQSTTTTATTSASSPSSTTSTTSLPPSPASIQAITVASTNDDRDTPTSLTELCTTTTETDVEQEHPSDPLAIDASDSSYTNTEDGSDDPSPESDVVQQLSLTLPPLPDLIPIRKAQQQLQQQQQLQEIDIINTNTNSCCSNNQQQQQQQPQQSSPAASSSSSSLSSSQILSVSSKTPVERDAAEDPEAAEYTEAAETTEETEYTENQEEDDEDPQHSTSEDINATSTSIATESTGIDNQTIMYHDGSMLQQHTTIMLQDQQQTPLVLAPNSHSNQTPTNMKKRGKKIKTEIEDPELCPIPHRKSDRRRVARDIFLVFEEHPANRRRGKGGKAKQPKSRPKSKFAHLMTDTKRPKKTNTTTTTTTTTAATTMLTTTSTGTVQPVRIKSEPKTPTSGRKSTSTSSTAKTPAPAPAASTSSSVPRVNPIFLWVKQEDTRIVEVRCEDYDKRNRIRLTKTASGWRATPRTDPTSSRVAKLQLTPTFKIKQELIEDATKSAAVPEMLPDPPSPLPIQPSQSPPPVATSMETEVIPPLPTPVEPLKPLKIIQPTMLLQNAAKKKKKKKKKKKRKHADEEQQESQKQNCEEPEAEIDDEDEEDVSNPLEIPENPIISTEPNHLVYESTNHEREVSLDDTEEVDEEQMEEDPPPQILMEREFHQQKEEIINEDDEVDIEQQQQQQLEEEEDESDLVQHMEPNNNEPSEELSKNLTQISDDLDLDDMPQFMEDVSPGAMQLCPETGLFIQKSLQVDDQDQVHDQELDHAMDHELEQEVDQEHEQEIHQELHQELHQEIDQEQDQEQDHHVDDVHPVVLSDSFDGSDVDTKNLKDLLDDADLLQHCSDNAMSGAELLDSLVKRGCEDNHISGDEPSIKETICLDDFENEDDDVLLQPEPVADIISRLGGSLTASPKCLSFNEAGEIEGLHGELFQSTTQNDPFNRHALEELSITIKDLEKSAEENYNSPAKPKPPETVTIVSPDSCVDEMPKDLTCKKSAAEKEKPQPPLLERPNSRSSDAIQSPQPSGLPAVPPSPDLVHSKSKNVFLEQLLNSSNSISPKICSSVTVTPIKIPNAPPKQQKEPLDLGKHRKSASPTVSCSEEAKRVQTVSIDDETPDEPLQKRIKREESEEDTSEKTHTENLIEMLSSGKDPDPLTQLRLLIRNPEWKVPDPILVPKDRLSAVLASPAREIPLLLTTRPELRLPEAFAYPAILQDPDILVISMAQLETILQKQVELTRPKAKTPPIPQVTIEAIPNPAKSRVSEKSVCTPSPDITVSSKKSSVPSSSSQAQTQPQSQPQQNKNFMNPLMGDIDAATLAAFNQMLWLPYLGQMAPEFIKAMAGLQNANNLAELLPLLQQQQNVVQQQHSSQQQQNQKSAFPTPQFNPMAAAAAAAAGLTNPMAAAAAAFQNPLELAMWQEALTQAQMQRMLKLNAAAALAAQQQQQRESVKKSTTIDSKANAARSHYNATNYGSKQTHSNPPPSYHHAQTSQSNQRHHSASAEKSSSSSARSVPNPFYRPPAAGSTESSSAHRAKQKPQQHMQQNHQEQKPRVTCKSLSNLLQPERLSEAKMSNLMAMPGFDFGFNGNTNAANANPFQFASAAAAAAAAAASAGRSSGANQFANGGGGGGGANNSNSNSHATALHRNNHSASNMHGNMTSSQQQHHHQQHQMHQQPQQQHQQQQQQQQSKLKVKPGSHLIDPAALQRRLLNCEEMSEVGSTTNGLEEMMADPNAALWHPLFGNTQKTGYNSPWQWTTVTASGE